MSSRWRAAAARGVVAIELAARRPVSVRSSSAGSELIVSRRGREGHGRFGTIVVVVSRKSNPSRVLRPTTFPLGERSVKW